MQTFVEVLPGAPSVLSIDGHRSAAVEPLLSFPLVQPAVWIREAHRDQTESTAYLPEDAQSKGPTARGRGPRDGRPIRGNARDGELEFERQSGRRKCFV